MVNKTIQFELWEECNNHCTFCYLGSDNLHTPDDIKLNSLKNAYDKISDLSNYPEYNTISYLGGEFFQGQLNTPEIHDNFMKLMQKTAQLMIDGYVDECWIYVTLTIGDQHDLYEMLEYFKPVSNKLWILTSYDTDGRFHSQKMEDNWKYHMNNIRKMYPDIKFNITTILSSDCIRKYLNNEISFQEMGEEYNATFFFKQVGCQDITPQEYNIVHNTDFVPTRKLFLQFLAKFKEQETDIMWDKLCNIQYRADLLYRNGNNMEDAMMENIRHKDRGAEIEIHSEKHKAETEVAECGHLKGYHAYSDCDGCILCDKNAMN
jgi:hypothetical protein